MTREQIAEIQARASQATKGPWTEIHACVEGSPSNYPAYVGPERFPVAWFYGGASWERNANALFVGHAREDVPALCDALIAQMDENERLRKALDVYKDVYGPMTLGAIERRYGL